MTDHNCISNDTLEVYVLKIVLNYLNINNKVIYSNTFEKHLKTTDLLTHDELLYHYAIGDIGHFISHFINGNVVGARINIHYDPLSSNYIPEIEPDNYISIDITLGIDNETLEQEFIENDLFVKYLSLKQSNYKGNRK